MGGFPNFAISFSIISVLTGAVLLYGHGLKAGGPYVMAVGWPLVTLFTLVVAASMAEIASAIPTAGAMYHWSAFLGGRGWGWVTAWFNLIGLYSITAGIAYGTADFVAPLLGLGSGPAVTMLFAGILLSYGLVNHFGVRWLGLFNNLSAWYHMVVVALLVVALLLFAKLQPWQFLFETGFVADSFRQQSGTPDAPWLWFFSLGLLQAQWTYTGYDASAHISEETRLPRVNAPWGIYLSVAVSGVVGYVMLVAVTLAVQDLPAAVALENTQVFLHVLRTALGDALGDLMTWLVAIAMWFCGLASLSASARMIYAFARDGGLPFAPLWARVPPGRRAPVAAVWQVVVVAFLLGLYSSAFSIIVSISTIAMYISYALPIFLRLRLRLRGAWQDGWNGPWQLGAMSTVVNVVALLWIAVLCVLFVAPPNQQTGYTLAGFVAFLALYWFALGERRRFRGPKALATAEALYLEPQS